MFPASAGMNRGDPRGFYARRPTNVPRERGDEPRCSELPEGSFSGHVPRERGDEPVGSTHATDEPLLSHVPRERGDEPA